MKKLLIASVIFSLLLFGCAFPGAEPAPGPEAPPETIYCREETVVKPYVEEVCSDVDYQEEECSYRMLEYTPSSIEQTDLCTEDSECVGKSLYDPECVGQCSRAMKRCRMNITNDDTEKPGVWAVAASFAHGIASFDKNPETALILPGETHTFDFSQIYSLGYPVTTATCAVYVTEPPVVEDCILVSKTTTVCTNVTKYLTETREVCE